MTDLPKFYDETLDSAVSCAPAGLVAQHPAPEIEVREKVEEARIMLEQRAEYADSMADMLRGQDPGVASEHRKSAELFRTLLASHATQAETIGELVEALKPFAGLTVAGEDHTAFMDKYPAFAAKVLAARLALAKARPSRRERIDGR